MKSIVRFSFLCLSAFFALMLLGGCNDKRAEKDEMTKEVIKSPAKMPVGEPYSKIKVGMKYSEVRALIGEPMRDIGSGTCILVYNISPTEEFLVQTYGMRDDNVVINTYYKRSKK